MPTRVKICGITRAVDAELAVGLGAAALGFNFYPPSPRYVVPALARDIIRRLPPFVGAVGVFADQTDGAHVTQVARVAGVSAVQLHGPKYPALEDLGNEFPAIIAIQVGKDFNPADLGRLSAAGFLLDACDPELRGGTGKTFDWSVAKEAKRYGNIILAGGLTPENAGRAIREVRPYAVDVASGVESAPGVKDAAKLKGFFVAVADADNAREVG